LQGWRFVTTSATVNISFLCFCGQPDDDYQHHHHKHQGLDPLICSVSRVTAARANASSVFQLFSFLAVCSDDYHYLPKDAAGLVHEIKLFFD